MSCSGYKVEAVLSEELKEGAILSRSRGLLCEALAGRGEPLC